jgi:tetratricopeptide (TPR) repeat protein
LIDLYNQTGQAHRSFDLIVDNALDVPSNTARDGSYARKLGETYLLIGNYQAAVDLWGGRAIPTLRRTQSESVMEAGRLAILGDAYSIIKASLEATSQIGRQANWEYDLGMAYLEVGKPKDAADHLTRAIELAPKLPLRPIVEYYLGKLGKPIPQGPGETKK